MTSESILSSVRYMMQEVNLMLETTEIVETPSAVEKVRNFPESRHRSKRIHKKLVRRFGSEFIERPSCYQIDIPNFPTNKKERKMLIHPTIMRKLEYDIKLKLDRDYMSAIYGTASSLYGIPIRKSPW